MIYPSGDQNPQWLLSATSIRVQQETGGTFSWEVWGELNWDHDQHVGRMRGGSGSHTGGTEAMREAWQELQPLIKSHNLGGPWGGAVGRSTPSSSPPFLWFLSGRKQVEKQETWTRRGRRQKLSESFCICKVRLIKPAPCTLYGCWKNQLRP